MEVLVVDNSPRETDAVSAVAAKIARETSVAVRCVREPHPGLGFARNAGITAAQGEIVAFVDDDAVVDPAWAAEVLRTYDETGAAVVGGKIDPIWTVNRPAWLGDDLLGYLAILDYGPERKLCHFPNYPFGVNISFRRSVLLEIGGFATSLGGGGAPTYVMDEIEVCRRIERAGLPIVYTPAARVGHVLPASRLTRSFFLRRAALLGRATARMGWTASNRHTALARCAKGELLAAGRAIRHGARALVLFAGRREQGFVSECRHLIWNATWMWETGLLALKNA
jgi:GT2 family glycosyltransferase